MRDLWLKQQLDKAAQMGKEPGRLAQDTADWTPFGRAFHARCPSALSDVAAGRGGRTVA